MTAVSAALGAHARRARRARRAVARAPAANAARVVGRRDEQPFALVAARAARSRRSGSPTIGRPQLMASSSTMPKLARWQGVQRRLPTRSSAGGSSRCAPPSAPTRASRARAGAGSGRAAGRRRRRTAARRRRARARARSKASSMIPSPLRGSKRPEEEDDGSPLARSACDRRRGGREVLLVDAVRDHAPVELGEVVVERRNAGLRDDDVAVQPAERGARGGVHEVAHAARREDRVVRADADRARGQHERREHEEARVVGRVDVHDVELPLGEEAPQLPAAERDHGVQRLRAVAVERHRDAHVHELDAVVRRARARRRSAVARRVQQAPGQDRHLVPARSEAPGLPVDVLGDAPELRVVVVGQRCRRARTSLSRQVSS